MKTWTVMACLAALSLGLGAQDKKYRNSYMGKAPPELSGEADQWFNTKEPLSLAKLKGKVVWLEFSYTH